MKTKEEIDKLYHKCWDDFSNKYDDNLHYYSFVEGYTQCQEDMADKWFEYPKNIPPIHSENYLVVIDGYVEIDLFRGDHNKFHSELYNKNCNITHWMPLPNKPLNKQD
jgi:hypothetical protein